MTTTVFLLTGLSTVAAIVCLACVWIALGAVQQCHKRVEQLREDATRIMVLEADSQTLQAQFRRLRGRVYADERHQAPPEPPASETPEQTRARLRAQHGLPKIGGTNGKAE